MVDVPRLPPEIRSQLTSDFGAVADFFAERTSDNYQPSTQVLKHPQAVLQLLRVFTEDERYQEIENDIIVSYQKGEKITMCEFAERMENQGIHKGKIEGRVEGKIESIFELLTDLGTVPDEVREKITAEKDENRLKQWLKLAAKADTMEAFIEKM